jgi:hypothetical protein
MDVKKNENEKECYKNVDLAKIEILSMDDRIEMDRKRNET